MRNFQRTVAALATLLPGSLALAEDGSGFSIVTLHGGMSSYIDLARTDTVLALAGFSALAAAIAYRLIKAKRR